MLRRRFIPVALCVCAGLLAAPAASPAYVTGIGDQQSSMFGTPAFQALSVPIVRYIAPYDAVKGGLPEDAINANAFISAARANHSRVLVAFYHSRKRPNSIPSTTTYKKAVSAFIKRFPAVKEYQPWNEANRGQVPGLFKSPSPKQSAGFYKTLKSVCRGCTLTGLDLLDQANIKPSIAYLRATQRALGSTKPTVWGLHNYSDTNRFRNKGTKAFLKAVKGQVWLTETGGIVSFGSGFPGGAAGQTRAAKALSYMFTLASSNSRIKRLYIFQWTGAQPGARFDAGLTGPDGATPRPGYYVAAAKLSR